MSTIRIEKSFSITDENSSYEYATVKMTRNQGENLRLVISQDDNSIYIDFTDNKFNEFLQDLKTASEF